LTRKVSKLIAFSLVVIVALGYWLIAPAMASHILNYTNQQTSASSSWTVISDGSLDLMDQNGKIVGDLGQPYADIASLSYIYNGSLFFRFSLHGKIPNSSGTHVTDSWYQVILDSDLNPSTGYLSFGYNGFTPDYILMFHVVFNNTSSSVQAYSPLWKYSGSGTDWNWQPVGSISVIIAGGVGQDFVILTCKYQDLSVSKASTVQFMARSGLRYDGQVYDDQVPDQGIVKVIL